MSVEAMAWVLNHSPATGTARLVLIGLANHAGPDGRDAWPSTETLARYARVHRRNVQRALRQLELEGAVVVERQIGGRHDDRADRRPNRYRIIMGPPDGVAPPPPRGPEPEPDGVALVVERGGAGGSHGVAPPPPEPSYEPSMNRPTPPTPPPAVGQELELAEVPPAPPAPRAKPADPFELFWTAYPRKVAKGEARKAWPRALRAAGGEAPIIAGAWRLADDPNREEAFTPHPATWLRAERWDDPPLPDRAAAEAARRRTGAGAVTADTARQWLAAKQAAGRHDPNATAIERGNR